MWIPAGFGALGLLIGTLIGLSAESLVKSMLSLLFTLVGGSVVLLLHKLGPEDRKVAGASIFSMSVCCMLALYAGILVTQFRLLSPSQAIAGANTRFTDSSFRYLRSSTQERANQIDTQLQNKQITQEQAYEQMYQLAREKDDQSSH